MSLNRSIMSTVMCSLMICGLWLTGCLASSPQSLLDASLQNNLLTPTELQTKAAADDDLLILDVRSPQEYAAGHIPNAINIPYDEMGDRLNELPAGRSPIVVYCERGVRARVAEQVLAEQGFATTFHLEGHMQRWRRLGLPIEVP